MLNKQTCAPMLIIINVALMSFSKFLTPLLLLTVSHITQSLIMQIWEPHFLSTRAEAASAQLIYIRWKLWLSWKDTSGDQMSLSVSLRSPPVHPHRCTGYTAAALQPQENHQLFASGMILLLYHCLACQGGTWVNEKSSYWWNLHAQETAFLMLNPADKLCDESWKCWMKKLSRAYLN